MEEDGGSYVTASRSLNDDTNTRQFRLNGSLKGSTAGYLTNYTTADKSVEISTSGSNTGFFAFDDTDTGSNTGAPYISASSGTYFDILAPVTYSVSDWESISVDGSFGAALYAINAVNAGNRSIQPNSAQIIINDTPVGDILTASPFDFSGQTITITEDINYIGIRFTFTSDAVSTGGSAWNENNAIYVKVSDSVSFIYNERTEEPEYIPILTEILQAIRNLPELIVGAFTLPDKQEQADQFQEDMSGAVSNMDNIKQEIEEGLEKPEPETIVPDIDIIVDSSDEYHVQYTQILSDLLGNAMITNLLLIVASMTFVSYVLFGKKR